MKIIKSIKNKIKDLFNVAKYRRKANTLENKYIATTEKYVDLLESDRSMLNENVQLKEQIREQKKEIKELKRIIEEDMQPKKKGVK